MGSSPSSSPQQLCSLEHVIEPQYSANAEGWKSLFFDFPVHMLCVFVSHSILSDSLKPHVSCQVPLSMGFSRQEYWRRFSFPFPKDLPDPGIEPESTALQSDS